MLSTEHSNNEIAGANYQYKPQMILAYNDTKGSVDTLDMMVKDYSCRRATRRWTLALFENFIDIAALNAFVIWTTKNTEWVKDSLNKRSLFLKSLSIKLVTPYVKRRSLNLVGIPSSVITDMSKIVSLEEKSSSQSSESQGKGRCHICSSGAKRSSRRKCEKCNKYACLNHSEKVTKILCNHCK